MNSRSVICISALTLCSWITLTAQVRTQGHEMQGSKPTHHHYQLIDLGTLGGPASYFSNGFDGILNHKGTAVGWADTSTPDPDPTFCFNFDCSVSHAFESRNGSVSDLSSLATGWSSAAFW